MHPLQSPVGVEIDDTLPSAVDPHALSLNENPFPPLPAVRSALIRSIDAANRYPDFLPERLRGLIGSHVGLPADHVVLGAGATGVVLQALQTLTVPGDAIAMSAPTFDGYPIVARMTGLESLTVPLDEHGHNDLDGLADAAANARIVVVCRPHNPTGTLEPLAELLCFLDRVPRDTVVLLDEAYIEFAASEHQIDVSALIERFPNVVVVRTFSKAYGLASLPAVAACYDAEDQLQQRIQLITTERRYLRMRLSAMGIYTTDAHANFIYLPPRGGQGQLWREVFADSGLHVRCYPDGAARISVGSHASSLAVLSTVGKSVTMTAT
jgi:histidinol-phosphate aminotransferase